MTPEELKLGKAKKKIRKKAVLDTHALSFNVDDGVDDGESECTPISAKNRKSEHQLATKEEGASYDR